MPADLRLIAVHVEEPKPGRFAWVLTERSSADWGELDRSTAAVPTYRKAMADGLLALQALVDDLDRGPRAAPAPAGAEATAHRHKKPGAAPAASTAYFGFGPAR